LFDVLVVELVLTPPLPPLPLLLLRLSIISFGSGVIIVFVVSLEDIVESGCSGGDADSATSNSLSAVANGMNMSRRGNGWFEQLVLLIPTTIGGLKSSLVERIGASFVIVDSMVLIMSGVFKKNLYIFIDYINFY
jgi:ABC-type proline/glycine betaine transport system permease subunit